MYSYYYDDYPVDAFGPVFLGILGSVLLVVLFFALALGIVFYVFRSFGLYRIAQRRQIAHSWLAWVPVADNWIVGSISDQYQYVAKGKNRSLRFILLGLSVAQIVIGILNLAGTLPVMLAAASGYHYLLEVPAALHVFSTLLVSLLSIAILVFHVMAHYDIYCSCDPDTGIVYCILGTLFSFLEPFFLFACRNKDGGMPPRRTDL